MGETDVPSSEYSERYRNLRNAYPRNVVAVGINLRDHIGFSILKVSALEKQPLEVAL